MDNCVIEQLSKAQFKDLHSLYSRFFKIHTCNKLESLYANRLLSLVNDYIGIDGMESRVEFLIYFFNISMYIICICMRMHMYIIVLICFLYSFDLCVISLFY